MKTSGFLTTSRKRRETPIKCNACKRDTGLKAENFMGMMLTDDVKCPRCGETVIFIYKSVC